MSRDQANKLIQSALNTISFDDITHRGFLKPIEVALKTYQTEMFEGEDHLKQTKLKPGSLPIGLKIAVSASQESQRKSLHNIQEITSEMSMQQIRQNNQDNMLALMKKKKGIKLAICVCMYSETKPMLKNTLAGIAENIQKLVAYEKMDPDDIGVFVMMDGIEKVDESILSYYEELEKSSNINLGDHIAPSLSMQEIRERANRLSVEEINEEQMKNVNNFLFTPAEIDLRNNIRFESIQRDYQQMKKLKTEIQTLSKKKIYYHDLTTRLQQFFIKEARKQRKRDYDETDQQVNKINSDVLIQQYGSDINRSRPLIAKALKQAQQYCQNYLSSKEDLAHMSYFRKKVNFDGVTISQSAKEQNGYRQMDGGVSNTRILLEEVQFQEPRTVMNLFMCAKYKNAGKLSSHNWFFNGICQELRPQYAVLLDVGLRPEGEAILKMFNYMSTQKNRERIGGVCGYMSLKMEMLDQSQELKDDDIGFMTNIAHKFVDIQRTQQVEYHFAHLMDKPFEASFGFIHVLPGAFSAYNMKAIIKYDSGQDDDLLKDYFKSIRVKVANQKITSSTIGVRNAILRTALPDMINSCCITVDPESDQAMIYNENVYLAEDRILCMGIHKKGFDMAFLPDAYAEVDPMKTVHGLLGQRKRWINGSYFAFEKVKKELSEFEKRKGCEICLNLQIFYLSFMNALSYFSPAFFMFTVHIAMQAFRSDVLSKYLSSTVSTSVLDFFVITMDFVYAMTVISIVFLSLHFKNGDKHFKPLIYAVSTIFGFFMIIIIGVLAVDIIRGLTTNSTHLITNLSNGAATIDINLINLLRWLLIGSLGLYFVPLLFYWLLFCNVKPLCEVLIGYLSFLFYTPTYLNILNIYSLCKIDDISWGTKGLDGTSTHNSSLSDSWRLIKFVHVAKYVIWNIILSAVLLTLGSDYRTRFWVTFGMVCLIGASLGIKVLIGVIYMMIYKCRSPSKGKNPVLNSSSRIKKIIEQKRPEIEKQIAEILDGMKNEYDANQQRGSFIQASRSKKCMRQSLETLSKVQKKSYMNKKSNNPIKNKKPNTNILFPIMEKKEEGPSETDDRLKLNTDDAFHVNENQVDKQKFRKK